MYAQPPAQAVYMQPGQPQMMLVQQPQPTILMQQAGPPPMMMVQQPAQPFYQQQPPPNPNAQAPGPRGPVMPRDTRAWRHTVFSCTQTLGTCLATCFCPCMMYGKNKARMEGKTSCFLDCCLYSCLFGSGCFGILGASNRAAMRAKYALDGDTCNDCVIHACCCVCGLTQEKRELDHVLAATHP